MELHISGEREQEQARSLLLWLLQVNLPGVKFDQKRAPLTPNAMGGELIPVLTAIAASPVITEVVKALLQWFIARQPKVKVTVNLTEGVSFTVDAENVQDTEALLRKIRTAVESAG
jgi:hypothetical protein